MYVQVVEPFALWILSAFAATVGSTNAICTASTVVVASLAVPMKLYVELCVSVTEGVGIVPTTGATVSTVNVFVI